MRHEARLRLWRAEVPAGELVDAFGQHWTPFDVSHAVMCARCGYLVHRGYRTADERVACLADVVLVDGAPVQEEHIR